MRFLLCTLFSIAITITSAAHADEDTAPSVEGRYASIVVDADTLEVLHARQIDELRYPASLTKVMTLFLVFDALEAGTLDLKTEMPVSKRAASASPTKLGLKAGSVITVEEAIQGLAVKSANDASVVIAEHLAGSVEAFTDAMTERAAALGMRNTRFRTPNGLPDPEQVTTARDMAKLATAVLRTHPEHYRWFGQKRFIFDGRTYRNTNGLLHSHDEVDGFKTGFTNASGYNLMVSAKREDSAGVERRVIAVVLGGASGKSRNRHMADLLDQSFETLGLKPLPPRVREVATVDVEPLPEAKPVLRALSLRRSDGEAIRVVSGEKMPVLAAAGTGGWRVRVGRFPDVAGAHAQLGALFGLHPRLSKGNAFIQPVPGAFEARFTDLTFVEAESACATLRGLAGGCSLIAPSRG